MAKDIVPDSGLEVIRKAAQDSEDGRKYDLRSIIVSGEKLILDKEQFEELLDLNRRILDQLVKSNLYFCDMVGEEY